MTAGYKAPTETYTCILTGLHLKAALMADFLHVAHGSSFREKHGTCFLGKERALPEDKGWSVFIMRPQTFWYY